MNSRIGVVKRRIQLRKENTLVPAYPKPAGK